MGKCTIKYIRAGVEITLISGLMSLGLVQSAFTNEPLVLIEGDIPESLELLLENALGEVDEKPRSLAQARRRAIQASKSAMSVLRSQGYYAADVIARVIEVPIEAGSDEASPPEPVLKITPGKQFTFAPLVIDYVDTSPAVAQGALDAALLKAGQPAFAAQVVASELKVLNHLHANGYADAVAQEREAIVDHKTHLMSVTYNIKAGSKTIFGEIETGGSADLSQKWAIKVAPFSAGDEYDAGQLNLLASRISGTGDFDSATAVLSDEAVPNGDGTVTRQVLLNVEQGKQNSISGEIGFSTTDGSGLDVSYERRNVNGGAQTLTLTSSVKTNLISAEANYNVPFAFGENRELDFDLEIARENTDAFEGDRAGGSVLLTQKISKTLNVGVGLGFEASRFEENGAKTTSYLTEGLGRATYDTRNSIFDPDAGYYAEAILEPTYNFGEEEGAFATLSVGGSTYHHLSDKFVLAGRAKVGTIYGSSLASVPLNKRFYAGGGGSVRGYGYQTISPADDEGDPSGGRSITELGGELRYKGEGPFGFAAFLDAGSASENETPSLRGLRAGAGVGVRYYTSFAPLRADIAVPLDRRDGDNAVQLYISIGQAF